MLGFFFHYNLPCRFPKCWTFPSQSGLSSCRHFPAASKFRSSVKALLSAIILPPHRPLCVHACKCVSACVHVCVHAQYSPPGLLCRMTLPLEMEAAHLLMHSCLRLSSLFILKKESEKEKAGMRASARTQEHLELCATRSLSRLSGIRFERSALGRLPFGHRVQRQWLCLSSQLSEKAKLDAFIQFVPKAQLLADRQFYFFFPSFS